MEKMYACFRIEYNHKKSGAHMFIMTRTGYSDRVKSSNPLRQSELFSPVNLKLP